MKPLQTKLLYFAALREALQRDEELVSLPAGATGQGVLDWLEQRYPAEARLIHSCSLAQNEEFLGLEESVNPGAVLALMPPVSGG